MEWGVRVRNEHVQSPALHNTFTPVLCAFMTAWICWFFVPFIAPGYFKMSRHCWCAFQLSLWLELLQGQFAWKQELISFLLPCSFCTWRLSPCLRHHSSALKKWTLRTLMHLSKPPVRKARQPLVPVFHMCGWSFRNIQHLFMKISFES